jgi:hypothetical protein
MFYQNSTRYVSSIPRNILLLAFVFFFACSNAQQFPASRQSDDQLLSQGKSYYDKNDYASAAVYLYAYLQRKPSKLGDATFRDQLYQALDYSIQKGVTKQGLAQAGLDDKSDNGSSTTAVYHQKPSLSSGSNNTPSVKIQSTGHWNCSDGGTYYIHQVGYEVWWYGQSAGANGNKGFANVMHGRIDPATNLIIGQWADVPSGSSSNSGEITLQIVDAKKIRIVSKSGGFSGAEWNAAPVIMDKDVRNASGATEMKRNKQ